MAMHCSMYILKQLLGGRQQVLSFFRENSSRKNTKIGDSSRHVHHFRRSHHLRMQPRLKDLVHTIREAADVLK